MPENNPQTGNTIPVRGEFTIDSCSGLNGSAEKCYWRYLFNAEKCSEQRPCSKLVVFFSGGEMTCDESFNDETSVYSKVLKAYSDDGYLAVCAGNYISNEVHVPMFQEAARINEIMKAVRSAEVTQAIWDGKDLLWAGVSHGATATVSSMANSTYDNQDLWKGSDTTAACFHDGIYDPLYASTFLQAYPISCNFLRNVSFCQRYVGIDNCTDPSPPTSDILADTVVSKTPTAFSIPHWKLVECGSEIGPPPCVAAGDADRDWVPAAPIEALCSNINASPTHTCTYGSQPLEGHLSCAGTAAGTSICRSWFNNLVSH
jgi:hypothetical protein